MQLGVPVSVTIEHESEDTPPNSNNQTLHTHLPQTVVAEVHPTTPSEFEVLNIRYDVVCLQCVSQISILVYFVPT